MVIHTREDYASLLELVFKTEFLSVFHKNYSEQMGHPPNIKFSNRWATNPFLFFFTLFSMCPKLKKMWFYSIEFKVKKEGWGGGGTRQVKFAQAGFGDKEILTPSGKILTVSIGPGLPVTSSKFLQIILTLKWRDSRVKFRKKLTILKYLR